MEYLKENYLGAVAAKIIVENKEEIAKMIENGNYKNIQGALLPFLIEKEAIVKKFFINFYIIYFKK